MAPVSFAEAIKITKLDSNIYKINLDANFCIGKVPNGGYTASCMLFAANAHLSPRDQSDTLTAHFEYPSTTTAGPAIVVIEEVKLGRQLSRLHLTLYQDSLLPQKPWINPRISRRVVLAYTIHTNLSTFGGISQPTGYEMDPANALPPLSDFQKLKINGVHVNADADDENWELSQLPKLASHMRSLNNWCFYLPRNGPLTPGVLDMWMCLASGERITQETLAYMVDSFPWNLHSFTMAPEVRKLRESEAAAAVVAAEQGQGDTGGSGGGDGRDQRLDMWFPTLVLDLEMKNELPEEGVEWLCMSVMSKQVKDGRFDLDVVVRDFGGEIVALSRQVGLVLMKRKNAEKAVL